MIFNINSTRGHTGSLLVVGLYYVAVTCRGNTLRLHYYYLILWTHEHIVHYSLK